MHDASVLLGMMQVGRTGIPWPKTRKEVPGIPSRISTGVGGPLGRRRSGVQIPPSKRAVLQKRTPGSNEEAERSDYALNIDEHAQPATNSCVARPQTPGQLAAVAVNFLASGRTMGN